MNDKSIDSDHDDAGPLADDAATTEALAAEALALESATEPEEAPEGPATFTGGAPVVARSTNPDTIEHEEN